LSGGVAASEGPAIVSVCAPFIALIKDKCAGAKKCSYVVRKDQDTFFVEMRDTTEGSSITISTSSGNLYDDDADGVVDPPPSPVARLRSRIEQQGQYEQMCKLLEPAFRNK
jgi:hypothetical protein